MAAASSRLHHAPGQRELDRAREADARQHQHRPGDARDAGVDLRLAHAHARMADAHIGQHDRLEGRAGRDAVERGETRLIETADRIVEVLPRLKPVRAFAAGLEFLGLLEVLAGAEGALAGARHDDGPHARDRDSSRRARR